MSSFGARVNPVGGVTADFGLGYPWYLSVAGDGGRLRTEELRATTWAVSTSAFSPDDVRHHRLRAARPLAAGRASARSRSPREGDIGGGSGRQRHAARSSATAASSPRWPSPTSPRSRPTASSSLWDDHFCPSAGAAGQRRSADAYCGYPPANDTAAATMQFPGGNPVGGVHRAPLLRRLPAVGGDRPADLGVLPVRVRAADRQLRPHAADGVRGQVQPGADRQRRPDFYFTRRPRR